MTGIGMTMIFVGVGVLVFGVLLGLISASIQSWQESRDWVPLAITVLFLWFLIGFGLLFLGKA